MTPALELRMCVGRGLDQTMAPITTPISATLADVDLLPEPVMLLVTRPGFKRSMTGEQEEPAENDTVEIGPDTETVSASSNDLVEMIEAETLDSGSTAE